MAGHRYRNRLSAAAGEVELVHRSELTPAMQRVPVLRSDVRRWFSELTREDQVALSDALEDVGFRLDPRDDHSLASGEDRLNLAIERAEIVGVHPLARPVSAVKAPPKPATAAQPPADKKPPTRISWVAIQLVDQTKEPISGIAYELKTPDGIIKTGVLDEEGSAHIEGIPAGSCEIRFPDLDTMEWSPG